MIDKLNTMKIKKVTPKTIHLQLGIYETIAPILIEEFENDIRNLISKYNSKNDYK